MPERLVLGVMFKPRASLLIELALQRFGLASTESKLKATRGGLAIAAIKAFGFDLSFAFGRDCDFDSFHVGSFRRLGQ